ncbi:protein-tyrosine phosphatase [Lineolata rhizophorae]|uniref:diphosphoinositol-polyphosphate diphosphatase n=1 Tax=Lineolata rhizophorae TaxID=578093 RepID=A0A6A6PCK8_9PEZI|nr:protein-tyrosine phosphatase [Lineolata rhizophorae]
MAVPPNYGAVVPGNIYRSGFPGAEHLDFLKSLKLKTIITLVDTVYPESHTKFLGENGITHIRVVLPANKDLVEMTLEQMCKVISYINTPSNWPLLIHCNKGKHRTGCAVACYQQYVNGKKTVDCSLEEYTTYAGKKARKMDEMFIEGFDVFAASGLILGMSYQPLGGTEFSLCAMEDF